MRKILILSSNIHTELAQKQLSHCVDLVKKHPYEYQIERLSAGAYEIPFAIQAYHRKQPFDGYIALGLILKKNLEHAHTILTHLQTCFTQFAMQNIIVGNGIISGHTLQDLADYIDSSDPCLSAYPSAFNAVHYLLQLQSSLDSYVT